MASGSKEVERKSRRLSGEEVINIDSSYPMCDKLYPTGKLPTLKAVLGRMRSLCGSGGGKKQLSREVALFEMAKEVYCKYYHDNICCMTVQGVVYHIRKGYDIMIKGNKRLGQGREASNEVVPP